MANPKHPEPIKLIASLIVKNSDSLHLALKKLVAECGAIDFVSEKMAFDYTDYYAEEMGRTLWRKIISFERIVEAARLPAIKRLTNEIERSLIQEPNHRTVNIDPGYINKYHLILATTKPAPHRPYLRDGIYADLTLIYQDKLFKPLPWTYPDYQSEQIVALMGALRKKYLFQLKQT